jgi:hypothetical protein
MAYRAMHIDQDPLNYFLRFGERGPFLRIADVVLRENKDPKEIFAHFIRIATGSKWSHSALIYLTSDPHKGYNNTFLVEARTKGIHLASWRKEVIPFDEFTVGIKRPRLDWYTENSYERSRHDVYDPEDTHGIAYLRHVRGIAVDQIDGLYDKKTVYELTALYAERAARYHLSAVPQIADAAGQVADLFKKWDASDDAANTVLRFICSGLVQYAFFEALRRRIMNGFDIPEHQDAAESNLNNLHRIIFREDPEGIIAEYIHNVQSGKLDIHQPAPEDVLDLLKTTTPADFNNSRHLEWCYVILKGIVWQISEAPDDYQPQSQEEAEVLKLLTPELHADL